MERSYYTITVRNSSDHKTVVPSYLHDSVITDFVSQRNNSTLRAVVTSCISRMKGGFKNRFSSENKEVWSAMESLVPCHYDKFMNAQLLAPLFAYILKVPTARNKLLSENSNEANFAAECQVFQRVLVKEMEKGTFKHDKGRLLSVGSVAFRAAFALRLSVLFCAPTRLDRLNRPVGLSYVLTS